MKYLILFISLSAAAAAQSMTVSPAENVFTFPNGVSVPSDYPHVKTIYKNDPDSGFIFINNWGGTPYIAILDDNGSPVFYRKMPANARDFKVNHNGMLSYRLAEPFYRFYEMDSSYEVTREITARNGYGTDEHDLQLLPNGNALLIALEYKSVDMSKLVAGGQPNATVIGNHVQEVDPNGKVVWEWKCWDHFEITDAVHENLTASTIDYIHMNAICVDTDSNIVISSRHLSEITKINRKTGAMMWRFGGKHNQFTILNDPLNGPSYQHDIRAVSPDNYTMMDNGNYHSPSVSRAVQYQIDTVQMRAVAVWQYRHTPDIFTGWMGNVQRLPNGNTLINWADQAFPKITEVKSDGSKTLEMDFVNPAHSYRMFKFPWKGRAKAPYLLAESSTDKITLLFNTFGDPSVAYYRIYGGTVQFPATVIDTTSRTAVDLHGCENGKRYYFRVTAVDSSGIESAFSNDVSLVARIVIPGENLLVNGDFSSGTNQWTLQTFDNAAASGTVTAGGEYQFSISNGGPQFWDVQLIQNNLPIEQGKKYTLEFDARGLSARTIDVKIEKASSPFTNYSKTGSVYILSAMKHFSYPFTMTDATDGSARVSFNCGTSSTGVIIDNVSVKEQATAGAEERRPVLPSAFELMQNYPNPFNPETTIEYRIPAGGRVLLTLHDVLGRTVATLVDELQSAGRHSVHCSISTTQLPSGIYFYTLTSGSLRTTMRMSVVK